MCFKPNIRNYRLRSLHAAMLAATLGITAIAPHAHACSVPDANTVVKAWDIPAFDLNSKASTAGQTQAGNTVAANTPSLLVLRQSNDPITGLWKVNFIAQGNSGVPDGTVLDAAIATWHADGTELMNSAKPPDSGNFCQGVWESTGYHAYKLHHLAMSWTHITPDAPTSTFIGPAVIQESINLSYDGTHFAGSFTITQYATDGITVVPLNPSLPAAPVTGTLAAVRVNVDD